MGFNVKLHERNIRVPEVDPKSSWCWSDWLSVCGVRVLAVILSRLHLEDVGNDAVNGDVTYQASEEELLCDARVHEAQRRETSQDTGQPGRQENSSKLMCSLFGKCGALICCIAFSQMCLWCQNECQLARETLHFLYTKSRS